MSLKYCQKLCMGSGRILFSLDSLLDLFLSWQPDSSPSPRRRNPGRLIRWPVLVFVGLTSLTYAITLIAVCAFSSFVTFVLLNAL